MLLLFFNPSVQGALFWTGPDPQRTLFVSQESRTFFVPAEQRIFVAV